MNTQNFATQEDLIQLENNLIQLIELICDDPKFKPIIDMYKKDRDFDQTQHRFIESINDFLSSATELEDILHEYQEYSYFPQSLRAEINTVKMNILNLYNILNS